MYFEDYKNENLYIFWKLLCWRIGHICLPTHKPLGQDDRLTLLCNHSHSGARLFEQRISNPNAEVVIHKMPMVYDFVEAFGRLGKIALIHKFLIVYRLSFFIPYYILAACKRLKINKYDSWSLSMEGILLAFRVGA